jgi:hypothetical protein
MVSQNTALDKDMQFCSMDQSQAPIFSRLLRGLPASFVPWIGDAHEVPVGSTGYLDRTEARLFRQEQKNATGFNNPIRCGKDVYGRRFVSMHLQFETSKPQETRKRRHILTVFERYVGNADFLVICVSHRSLDVCHNSFALLSLLFGTSGLKVTDEAIQELNSMVLALYETGAWEKRISFRSWEWTPASDEDEDVEVVARVTFCHANSK